MILSIIISIIILSVVAIFGIWMFLYLFRGPGSSGYYRRGRRYF